MMGELAGITADRREAMLRELLLAIEATSSSQLRTWAARTGSVLVGSTARRIKNVGTLVSAVGEAVKNESIAIVATARKGVWKDYVAYRQAKISNAVGIAYKQSRETAKKLKSYTRSDPEIAARDFAAFIIGFYVGSGGVDGDGGVPDLDLAMGIGEHRSIFTHSIIAGVAIETLIVSFVDLVSTIHVNLPADHDPVWDSIQAGTEGIGDLLGRGVSAGIAYHLTVDATVDGAGTYVDLPPMPLEGHQILGAANAVAEAVDAVKRPKLNYGDIVETYGTFAEAGAKAKGGGPYKVRRSTSGRGFDVIFIPKRT